MPFSSFVLANIYGVWGSQIYQEDDAPDFKRGNLINIGFAGTAFFLWFVLKGLYVYRNRRNEKKWERMTVEQRKVAELNREAEGNRSVTFRFTT